MSEDKYKLYDLIVNRQGTSRDHGRIWFNAGMGVNTEEDYYYYYITFDNYGDDSFDDEYQDYHAPQGNSLTYEEFMHDIEFVSEEYGFRIDMEELTDRIEQIKLKEMKTTNTSKETLNNLIDKYAEDYIRYKNPEYTYLISPMDDLDTIFDEWGYCFIDAYSYIQGGYSFSKDYKSKKPFDVWDDFIGWTTSTQFPSIGEWVPISLKESQRIDFLKQEIVILDKNTDSFLNWCRANNKK